MMSNFSKPLYALTVEEFTELNKTIFKEQLQTLFKQQAQQETQKNERDLIFLEEACQLTGYSKPTIYSKISKYEIPVLSRGKPLTFSRQALANWIHAGKPSVIDTEMEDYFNSIPKRK